MSRKPKASPRPTLTPAPGPIIHKGLSIKPSGRGVKPTRTFADMFPVAAAPPNVPRSVTVAMDGAMQPFYGYAQQWGYGEGVVWLGFPYLAELTQRPEYRMITETRAKEMTRKGFELTSTSEDDPEQADKLRELEQACKDFRVIDHLRIGAEHDGFYGGGMIFIDTGDSRNPEELKKPLIIDKAKIPQGGLKGFRNLEAMWAYPGVYNSTLPLEEDYFRPETWYVNGIVVHRTRLISMISRVMPDILKPAYSFRGLSLSQMAKPYVDNWLRTRQSVSDIVHSFSVMVLSTVMQSQLMGGGKWDSVFARVDEFNAMRDNRGTFVIDKEAEDFKNVSAPLGTLDALQDQAQEQLCSVSQTPAVKLLGTSPKGFGTSDEGQIRVFYDLILSCQEHLYRDPLKVMLECIQLHLWGEIDPDIGFEFVPLWQLDEAGMATVEKANADTAAVWIEAGVIGADEQRQILTADKNSPYAGLDPDDVPEAPAMQQLKESVTGDPAKGVGETKKEERDEV